MNEIKFRAWLIKNKKMVEVKTIHLSTRKIMYGYSNGPQSYGNKVSSFKDVILMQSTGLKDINGKDIYDGDILKSNSEEISDIKLFCIFENGCFHIKDFDGWNIKMQQKYLNMYKIEVIGNIYENEEIAREVI